MSGTLVMVGEKVRRVRRDHTAFIIGAGKLTDRGERFPKSDCDEFYFVRSRLAQNITALVTGDAMNGGKDAGEKQVVVSAGILRLGVAVPKSRDHAVTVSSVPRTELHFLP